MRESTLYPKVGRFLASRGWRVAYGVPPRPGSPRRFDVVGVKARKREAVVVEAKLDHYRRTLEQASVRLFVADFVYLSFPDDYARSVYDRRLDDLKALGLGLLGIDSRVHEYVSPDRSGYLDPERRADLIAVVVGKRGNHG